MTNYYKVQRVHDEHTTYSVIMPDIEGEFQGIIYTTIDDVDYLGVDMEDPAELESWLASQPEQITLIELAYDEILPILKQSHIYLSINNRVVAKIRERYSMDDELRAARTGRDAEMDAYIAQCVAWGDEQKRLAGL